MRIPRLPSLRSLPALPLAGGLVVATSAASFGAPSEGAVAAAVRIGPAGGAPPVTILVVRRPAAVSFAEDVMPILERSCTRCHGGLDDGHPRKEASLDLTTWEGIMFGSEYGEVVTPGDPAESFLLEMIEKGDMPEESDPLPPEEIETIRTWIAEGAEKN